MTWCVIWHFPRFSRSAARQQFRLGRGRTARRRERQDYLLWQVFSGCRTACHTNYPWCRHAGELILLFLGAVSQPCGLAAKHLSEQPPAPARAPIVSLHSCLRYMGGVYPAAMRGGAETKYFYSTKRRPKPDRRPVFGRHRNPDRNGGITPTPCSCPRCCAPL